MDPELIRKAAEAILHADQQEHGGSLAFSELTAMDQRILCSEAEAALKVFLEHTRSQPQEQAPPKCPDCGAMMLPSMKIGRYMCPSCGKVQDG